MLQMSDNFPARILMITGKKDKMTLMNLQALPDLIKRHLADVESAILWTPVIEGRAILASLVVAWKEYMSNADYFWDIDPETRQYLYGGARRIIELFDELGLQCTPIALEGPGFRREESLFPHVDSGADDIFQPHVLALTGNRRNMTAKKLQALCKDLVTEFPSIFGVKTFAPLGERKDSESVFSLVITYEREAHDNFRFWEQHEAQQLLTFLQNSGYRLVAPIAQGGPDWFQFSQTVGSLRPE